MLLLMPVMLFVIPYVPRFVIGGFLAHIGYMIVLTWCVATRRRMPVGEWLLVLGIVAITVWVGMVPAVIAGPDRRLRPVRHRREPDQHRPARLRAPMRARRS